MVRVAGLEPARVAPLPPQSSVSANSTIRAIQLTTTDHWILLSDRNRPLGLRLRDRVTFRKARQRGANLLQVQTHGVTNTRKFRTTASPQFAAALTCVPTAPWTNAGRACRSKCVCAWGGVIQFTTPGQFTTDVTSELVSKSSLGSTGDPPVPSGDPPDGMGVTVRANQAGLFTRQAPALPVRGSPTGAGESPKNIYPLGGGGNSRPYFFPISITRGMSCCCGGLSSPISSKNPSKPDGVMTHMRRPAVLPR